MQRATSRSQRSRAAAETAALIELLGSYENYGQVRDPSHAAEDGTEGACA
ncbi:MAG: hypothetical protein QNJ30_04415 [Kiloniellales bacterium]|nr:hypothetical protein [Kiloniellales bacterium]